MTEDIREQIYLGALLHDIGKFYQRASGSIGKEDDNLTEYSKNIADYICPKSKSGGFSHQHVIWTNEFFNEYKSLFENIKNNGENNTFKINPWDKNTENQNNLSNIAVNHHQPLTLLQAIIQMADWWSSGIDRRNHHYTEDNTEQETFSLKFKNFKQVPFFSIFNSLQVESKGEIDKKNKGNLHTAYTPHKLNIENVFPNEIKQDEITSLQADYKTLWDDFIAELNHENFPTDSFSGFEETLVALLKKYTWSIPSDTTSMANVSLFDHSKTTAAFADCLYEYFGKNKDAFEPYEPTRPIVLKNKTYPVALYGFDVSGIQSFIYDIANKKAAKSLKGRSFYLQLLVESIIQRLFSDKVIKAKSANILYAAGGKFYVLLPNTLEVKDAIDKLKKEIEEELWEQHKGKLSVNIAGVAFAYRNKKEDNEYKMWIEIENEESDKQHTLGDLWKTLSDRISKQKEQKFKSVLINDYDNFFGDGKNLKVGGDVQICVVTGEELNETNWAVYNHEEIEKDKKNGKIYSTKAVLEQTELGTALKDVDYIITFKDLNQTSEYLNKRSKAKITVLGVDYYLFDKLELISDDAEFRKITSADVSRVRMINKLNFLAAPLKGQKVSYGFLLYGGNKQAENEFNKEKTFEDLAKTETSENTLLGILRMDIDNLGMLFMNGLADKNKTFSAYSTMSFMLDLFFSGYLNELRNTDNFKDDVNILYSGGDDLFVVGRWDKTIEFAKQVRQKFKEYTNRDDIGISGGIAFVHEKFPISKAAEMAGDYEKMSKHFTGKDAITFFGETVSWEKEFETVENIKNKFVQFIKQENRPLSKAILHKLIQYNEVKNSHLFDKTKNPDYSFLWHTAYYMKRFRDKFIPKESSQSNQIDEFLKKLQDKLFTSSKNNYRHYELVALAARWAEMEIKYLNKN